MNNRCECNHKKVPESMIDGIIIMLLFFVFGLVIWKWKSMVYEYANFTVSWYYMVLSQYFLVSVESPR